MQLRVIRPIYNEGLVVGVQRTYNEDLQALSFCLHIHLPLALCVCVCVCVCLCVHRVS